MNYDSFESEKLRKLIDGKKQFLKKQTNKASAQYLQKEIMFLENEILPVVLTNTTVHHAEVMKYCIRCFDEAIECNCNALLIYVPIKDEYESSPIVGIANNRDMLDFGTPGAMQIYCSQVEILNTDGNGSTDNVKCFTLPINDFP